MTPPSDLIHKKGSPESPREQLERLIAQNITLIRQLSDDLDCSQGLIGSALANASLTGLGQMLEARLARMEARIEEGIQMARELKEHLEAPPCLD